MPAATYMNKHLLAYAKPRMDVEQVECARLHLSSCESQIWGMPSWVQLYQEPGMDID